MKRLRSIAFSIAFPLWTGICCIVLAFGPLLPRKGALRLAVFWVRSVAWVERHVLGLHYRVIELCTGDLGFSSARGFGVACVWASAGVYGELCGVSA